MEEWITRYYTCSVCVCVCVIRFAYFGGYAMLARVFVILVPAGFLISSLCRSLCTRWLAVWLSLLVACVFFRSVHVLHASCQTIMYCGTVGRVVTSVCMSAAYKITSINMPFILCALCSCCYMWRCRRPQAPKQSSFRFVFITLVDRWAFKIFNGNKF